MMSLRYQGGEGVWRAGDVKRRHGSSTEIKNGGPGAGQALRAEPKFGAKGLSERGGLDNLKHSWPLTKSAMWDGRRADPKNIPKPTWGKSLSALALCGRKTRPEWSGFTALREPSRCPTTSERTHLTVISRPTLASTISRPKVTWSWSRELLVRPVKISLPMTALASVASPACVFV